MYYLEYKDQAAVGAALFQRPPLEIFQHPFNAAGVVVAV